MISRNIIALAFGLALAAGGVGASSADTAVKADGAKTGVVKSDAIKTDPTKSGATKTGSMTSGSARTAVPAKSVAQRAQAPSIATSTRSTSRMASHKGPKVVLTRAARSHHARLRFAKHVASLSHAAKRPLAKHV